MSRTTHKMRSKELLVLTVILALILAALVGYVIWMNSLPYQDESSPSDLTNGYLDSENNGHSGTTSADTAGITNAFPEATPDITTPTTVSEKDANQEGSGALTSDATISSEPKETETKPQTNPESSEPVSPTEPSEDTAEAESGLGNNELPPM